MLIKYTGKYVKIYFIIKITYMFIINLTSSCLSDELYVVFFLLYRDIFL